MITNLFKTLGLATRDYLHEWQMSLCFVLGLAAVLGPMLVLFGLKFGIVGSMMDQLIEDPGNREIRPVGSGRFDRTWLESVRARPDVAFLVPRTRSIAATIDLASAHSSRIVPVELIPSDQGDPLLAADEALPEGLKQVVVSRRAAEKLAVEPGDVLDGSLVRRYRGQQERVHLTMTVAAIAPELAFSRDGAFVSVRLLEALEDFRDGRAVPELDWTGAAADTERSYPGFRLYARSINDVAGLRNAFAEVGVDVHTRVAEIDVVQRMDRSLTAIYWAIAAIGLGGVPHQGHRLVSHGAGAVYRYPGLGAGSVDLLCDRLGDQWHDGRTGGSGAAGLPANAGALCDRPGTDLRRSHHCGRSRRYALGTYRTVRRPARDLRGKADYPVISPLPTACMRFRVLPEGEALTAQHCTGGAL
jgi:putative ABC transport system permease protein